jgi:hypothetical protein
MASPRSHPFSFRFDPTTTAMIRALANELGISQADVVRLAVREYAKRAEIAVPVGNRKPVKRGA